MVYVDYITVLNKNKSWLTAISITRLKKINLTVLTSTLNTASIILILRSSILHNEHSFVVDVMLALKLNKAKCKNKH